VTSLVQVARTTQSCRRRSEKAEWAKLARLHRWAAYVIGQVIVTM
jgi:hypothetical protein